MPSNSSHPVRVAEDDVPATDAPVEVREVAAQFAPEGVKEVAKASPASVVVWRPLSQPQSLSCRCIAAQVNTAVDYQCAAWAATRRCHLLMLLEERQ